MHLTLFGAFILSKIGAENNYKMFHDVSSRSPTAKGGAKDADGDAAMRAETEADRAERGEPRERAKGGKNGNYGRNWEGFV